MGATGKEGLAAQQRELMVDAGSCRPTPLVEATLLFLLKKKKTKKKKFVVGLYFVIFFFTFIFIASLESYFHYYDGYAWLDFISYYCGYMYVVT